MNMIIEVYFYIFGSVRRSRSCSIQILIELTT